MALDETALDIGQLPAVLAGPILRRLTRTLVTVWLALSRGEDVTLTVRDAADATQNSSVTATPVQVGVHLWLLTITAQAPGGQFTAGKAFTYKLSSPAWPAEPDWTALSLDGTCRCRKRHPRGRRAASHQCDGAAMIFGHDDPTPLT
jgi:hypothetical protein